MLKTYTNSEIVNLADKFSTSYLKSAEDFTPVFLSLNLSFPLGMVALLGCAQSGRKAYLPASYNLADIAAGFQT